MTNEQRVSEHRAATGIPARVFSAAGVELRADADGVKRLARRENRRGLGLQRAIATGQAAGRPIVQRI